MRRPTMRSGLALGVLLVLPALSVSCQSKTDDPALSEMKAAAKQLAADIKELNAAVKATAQQKELAEVAATVAQLKDELAKSAAESAKAAADLADVKAELAKVKTQWAETREKWESDREELARLRKTVALLFAAQINPPGGESGGGIQPSDEIRPLRGRGPARLHPPTIDAVAAGAKAIELFDADKDGKLSGKELDKTPGLKAAIDKVDSAGTGEITADMIAARIRAWQATKLGRMSLSCRVTHNGQPLGGAEMKFVPEKFLGDKLQTATGKTDQNGMAMLSIPTRGPGDPPGVAPGFYRVEITKDGEKIPAKYNTDTVFGQEVALDAKGIQEGIVFDLDY